MANFDIIMPKMGESIEEATITNWFVKEGDTVEEDDILLEIATDKVDSEIPSPVAGVVKKVLYQQDETVAIGTVIAVIETNGIAEGDGEKQPADSEETSEVSATDEEKEKTQDQEDPDEISSGKFYSPLVRKIAREENISLSELESISGSGINGRVQKRDILAYLENRKEKAPAVDDEKIPETKKAPVKESTIPGKPSVQISGGDEVVEMSRMRKLIAEHMIRSKQVSAHVTNMLEIDVTSVVEWREKFKAEFQKKQGVKLTYLPVFLEATVKALRDFPQINASVNEDKIIIKKNINLGIAVALPDNNLIVPNIKAADNLNITGLAKRVSELAVAARNNKLSPDDISGGTFTVTNFGTFRNDIGTPIINQPEVAILAIGSIKKKPAVLETEHGDVIAIRHMMWISLTYDHRIVDGALGGAFLRKLGDYIESFNKETVF
ncbi:MAG: 2-oxo acid dehydrogenase subunit E2 [Bacteroidales bacterium]|nr:2-oxo acid dehydrogenase subunit E2 [Bacteroidales bacterium]